ncbi:MAG TPA: SAM-dependent methyltransferase [Kofleriaceae bacterium]|jgi:methyltransferase (TIGR00027 family)|nr:SAM-dependent methyltransferase [Kofleriaceae bacterium]
MAVSRTAQYVAMYRAFETDERRRTPLFRDPYARGFLSPGMAFLVQAARAPIMRGLIERYTDRRAPGARTAVIARTAYIDDAVRSAVAAGVDQVVILGAGFDCRAHRMPELRGAAVFEVDHADTQAEKRAKLPDAAGVRYVAVDFLRDDPGAMLAMAGWDPRRRSVFVWEGVTAYLTESAVTSVLGWISTTAAGTCVVFTYLHGGVFDGSPQFEGSERVMANVRRLGEPWTFGLKPEAVAAFVARCGLRLHEDLGADDYRRRYLTDVSRGYAFYRIAIAGVGAAVLPA